MALVFMVFSVEELSGLGSFIRFDCESLRVPSSEGIWQTSAWYPHIWTFVRSNTKFPHFGLAERSSGHTSERAHDKYQTKTLDVARHNNALPTFKP